jgi:hypothetical protein
LESLDVAQYSYEWQFDTLKFALMLKDRLFPWFWLVSTVLLILFGKELLWFIIGVIVLSIFKVVGLCFGKYIRETENKYILHRDQAPFREENPSIFVDEDGNDCLSMMTSISSKILGCFVAVVKFLLYCIFFGLFYPPQMVCDAFREDLVWNWICSLIQKKYCGPSL